jgi:hypothetical protein
MTINQCRAILRRLPLGGHGPVLGSR